MIILETIKKGMKLVLPHKLRKKLKGIMKYQNQNKALMNLYTMMCNSAIPGFVILNEYIEGDRIFDGLQYYSQYYQDYYLDRFIFKGMRDGVFLDIGANDPITINNTYFFEKERGWKGLAFEPMLYMNKKWKDKRNVECLNIALGKKKGKKMFIEYEDQFMSGFSDSVDYDGNVHKKYSVDVERLDSILNERSLKHVDFVSLDVEGAEMDVLLGIDFQKVAIKYFVIENNKDRLKQIAIREFMISNNYRLRAHLWIDDVWEKVD